MINFKIDEHSKSWTEDEPYTELFLHICPVKPVKYVENRNLKLDSDIKKYTRDIRIFRTGNPVYTDFPQLADTTYRFVLCSGPQGSGKKLACREIYSGKKMPLQVSEEPYGENVIRVVLQSSCRISEELFWAELAYDSKMGELFRFLPMKEERGKFRTSALMLKRVFDQEKLRIQIDKCISDFVTLESVYKNQEGKV